MPMALQLNGVMPPPSKSFSSSGQYVPLSLPLPRLHNLNLHRRRSTLKMCGGSSRSNLVGNFDTKARGTKNGLELLFEAFTRIPSDLDPTTFRMNEKKLMKDSEKKEPAEEIVEEIVTNILTLSGKVGLLIEASGGGVLSGIPKRLAYGLVNTKGRINEKEMLKDNEKKKLLDEIVTDAFTLFRNIILLIQTMPDRKRKMSAVDDIGKVVRVSMSQELEYEGLLISVDRVGRLPLLCLRDAEEYICGKRTRSLVEVRLNEYDFYSTED